MNRFIHVRMLVAVALTLVFTAAYAKAPAKTGIGVRIAQGSGGVVVTQVVSYTGAKLAGIEKDDVIVAVQQASPRKPAKAGAKEEANSNPWKETPTQRESMAELIGPACTYVNVRLQRGGEILEKKVQRVPHLNPGTCFGYDSFRTPQQRHLSSIGRLLYNAWESHQTVWEEDVARKLETVSSFKEFRRALKFFAERMIDDEAKRGTVKFLADHAESIKKLSLIHI